MFSYQNFLHTFLFPELINSRSAKNVCWMNQNHLTLQNIFNSQNEGLKYQEYHWGGYSYYDWKTSQYLLGNSPEHRYTFVFINGFMWN